MQKIIPNLWFNGNAEEAVAFYLDSFGNGEIVETIHYPSSSEEGLADFQLDFAGKVLSIDFRLGGFSFTAINAGSEFRPNPAISMMVRFHPESHENARDNLTQLWNKLIDGGNALMQIGEYDFSEHYGWVEDKYGVNWQLLLSGADDEPRPFIHPSLMFAGAHLGESSQAREYYVSVFDDSRLGDAYEYPETTENFTRGHLMFSEVVLAGQWFAMNDGGPKQEFTFTEGVSLAVTCKDQNEIDYLWSKLSSVPEAEQCGWCKDKFGVSWQIIPENMGELMQSPDAYKIMMEQKKIVISDYK